MSKTFFITGVSSGFGKALTEGALAAGHRVVGTLRKEDERVAFDQLVPGRSFGRLLDVTDTKAIAPIVSEVEKNVGPIDVLVNNAGYGHEGILEESPIDELRRQYEVNVFGAVAVTQAVLPFMRPRRAGHIINITSMGGFITLPGVSFYTSSKAALESISETLGKEVGEFGIKVTAVAPGGFRTDWAGRSMARTPRSIPDYDAMFNPVRERRQNYSGKQAGDPAKFARAVLEVIEAENPPAHLLLGNDALKMVAEKMEALQKDFTDWRALSASTDFDA